MSLESIVMIIVVIRLWILVTAAGFSLSQYALLLTYKPVPLCMQYAVSQSSKALWCGS